MTRSVLIVIIADGEATSEIVDRSMKQVIKQIRISELSDIVKQMNFNQNMVVDVTIETAKDDLLALMDSIGKEAQANGLTAEILEELLADES